MREIVRPTQARYFEDQYINNDYDLFAFFTLRETCIHIWRHRRQRRLISNVYLVLAIPISTISLLMIMSSSLTVVSYRVILTVSPSPEFTNPTKSFLRQMCFIQVVAESLKLSMFVIFIFIALKEKFIFAA